MLLSCRGKLQIHVKQKLNLRVKNKSRGLKSEGYNYQHVPQCEILRLGQLAYIKLR